MAANTVSELCWLAWALSLLPRADILAVSLGRARERRRLRRPGVVLGLEPRTGDMVSVRALGAGAVRKRLALDATPRPPHPEPALVWATTQQLRRLEQLDQRGARRRLGLWLALGGQRAV